MTNGYVYLFGNVNFGWLKIGHSGNPMERHSHLAGSLPFPLSIWDVRRLRSIDRARQLEHNLHIAFSECRLNGEWFDLKYFDVGKYFKLVKSYPDAFMGTNALMEIR